MHPVELFPNLLKLSPWHQHLKKKYKMKNTLLLLLLLLLPTCLYAQKEKKKLSIELTYGYDLSTLNSYKRKIITDIRAIGIIHNTRLGANISYRLHSKFYLLSGAKINMNPTPHAGSEDDNIFIKLFFFNNIQRDFYVVLPLRSRYYFNVEESSKWFVERGFLLYHYITTYRRAIQRISEKKFEKDVDYYSQKYSLNFSLGKEWRRRGNRKIAFQLIARFQLNESLDSNLPLVTPKPSHKYNHVGFEMRHSF